MSPIPQWFSFKKNQSPDGESVLKCVLISTGQRVLGTLQKWQNCTHTPPIREHKGSSALELFFQNTKHFLGCWRQGTQAVCNLSLHYVNTQKHASCTTI